MKKYKSFSILGLAMLLTVVMLHVSAAQSQHDGTIAQVRSNSAATTTGVSSGTSNAHSTSAISNGVVRFASLNASAGSTSGLSSASGQAKPYLVSTKKTTKKHKKKKHKKKKHKKKKKKKRRHSHRGRRVVVSRGAYRSCDVEAAVRRVGATYWPSKADQDALVYIYKHECVTPGTISSAGYYGLFQLGNPPKWMVLGDPASEARAGCEYIKRRYGNPSKAMAFKKKRGWY
ncbi:MAG: hypothetical protein ACYC56_09995 [Candidatus Aquicultor sp.]